MSKRNYWLVRTDGADGERDPACTYAMDEREAYADICRRLGRDEIVTLRSAEPIHFSWHQYAPDDIVREPAVSAKMTLRRYFFAGGRIGCDVAGIEVMFTPEIWPEPVPADPNDEDSVETIGIAHVKVRDRPDLSCDIVLEGLDEQHLVDRLSGEVVQLIGRMRKIDETAQAVPGRQA